MSIAIIPQDDSREMQQARRDELEVMRSEYEWAHDKGPARCKDVPKNEKYKRDTLLSMFKGFGTSVTALGFGKASAHFKKLMGMFTRPDSLKIYDKFFGGEKLLREPDVQHRWRFDEEFARQRLNGINPVLIQRCTEIPDNFDVTEEDVAGVLDKGDTLESKMKEGQLFILDYDMLKDIDTDKGRYLTAPYTLFHVDQRGRLMPAAVQLEPVREGGRVKKAGPVFTPKDFDWLWLTVKCHAQTADAHFHEVSSHLLRTHLVTEPVVVATHRHLHRRHPLHVMLEPHFFGTIAINAGARNDMVAPDGPLPKTMAAGYEGTFQILDEAYKAWSFDLYDLRGDFARRGVDDPELLPGYHYRDDALPIWDAIAEFTGGVVDFFYPTDAHIQADIELRTWAADLVAADGGGLRGIPGDGATPTRDQLKRIVTQIIFTASAEHASVNNGQFDLFGYVPNVPGMMLKPPPRDRKNLSETELCQSLPQAETASWQITMTNILSQPTDQPLGRYAYSYFNGYPVVQAVERFQSRLATISRSIKARNETIDVPYTYLDPEQIAMSIAI